jgi:2-oxoisovalerate dehydrogenase E2 component (dihydrolipoyl transacylase)
MTIEEIKMPQLGESVTEGTISKWLVSAGDIVHKYDSLAEVMTDKVTAEIPSSFTGTIKDLVAKEGDAIAVGEVICTLEVQEASLEKEPSKSRNGQNNVEVNGETANEKSQSQARFSPAVLRLASEHQIDLNQVKGTGAGGRITRRDLMAIINSQTIPQVDHNKVESAPSDPSFLSLKESQESASINQDAFRSVEKAGDLLIPVSGVRRSIAANMLRSKQEIPHAWTMVEADVTRLVQLRNSLKEEFKKKEGFNLTFFPFIVKGVAQALKEFPEINSMWAGDKIIQRKEINISIAVATEDALYVPVVKRADEKTIKGIAREISEYAEKARNGKLMLEDMQGGTFTINNTGAFGSIQSMGIINYPQAAILQVESIVKRPVVVDKDMIAIRDMVNLCLSLDHRVLDGLVCGRFLQRIKKILENISNENTSVY